MALLQNSITYIQNEYTAIQKWLDLFPDIKKHVMKIIDNKTVDVSATDYKLLLDTGTELLVEVKTEEDIFKRTGNITFDILSSFNFNENFKFHRVLSFHDLISNIENGYKFGTALYSDADILIKDIPSAGLTIAYDNRKLRSLDAKSHFVKNYPVHINPKEKYGICENWQSAFSAIAINDDYLEMAKINNESDFLNCLKPHCCVCGGVISEKYSFFDSINKYLCDSKQCRMVFKSNIFNVVNYSEPQKRT